MSYQEDNEFYGNNFDEESDYETDEYGEYDDMEIDEPKNEENQKKMHMKESLKFFGEFDEEPHQNNQWYTALLMQIKSNIDCRMSMNIMSIKIN